MDRDGRPAARAAYRVAFDGLDELAAKVEELSNHLEAAQELIEELSGVHELTPRAVRESELGGDVDGAAAPGADGGARLHAEARPA